MFRGNWYSILPQEAQDGPSDFKKQAYLQYKIKVVAVLCITLVLSLGTNILLILSPGWNGLGCDHRSRYGTLFSSAYESGTLKP